MRPSGEFSKDFVVYADQPACQHNAHDSRLPRHFSGTVAGQHRLQQSGAEPVNLPAGIAQTGYLNDGVGPDPQECSLGQVQEVEAAGGDVFPRSPGRMSKPSCASSSKSSAWIRCTCRRSGSVGWNSFAGMRISLDDEPFPQQDRFHPVLTEVVLAALTDGAHLRRLGIGAGDH